MIKKTHPLVVLGLAGLASVLLLGLGLGLFSWFWFGPELRSRNIRSPASSEALLQEHDRRNSSAERGNDYTGRLVARIDDRQVTLPALETDYDASVRGDLAKVTVQQRFSNPGQAPIHATYAFPLNERAAVHAMTMRVGERTVRAKIMEETAAEETFEKAKEDGKHAALLDQHRPNLFTQKVANIGPGEEVVVTLEYTQTVPKRDGRYRLTLPLVVGPRYNDGSGPKNALVQGEKAEPVPGSTVAKKGDGGRPSTIDAERVDIEVGLHSMTPIGDVESPSHAITTRTARSPRDTFVQLTTGRTVDNRHFQLNYRLSGDNTTAGLHTHWSENRERGYFNLRIEPPADLENVGPANREMVFVLDCSGSMSGHPMNASKAFMRKALRRLRPDDTFRIIRFSTTADEFSTEPQPATLSRVRAGLDHVEQLHGRGGTEMTRGIRQALHSPVEEGKTRLVVFLTDGYIGNEFEVTKLLRQKVGQARMFAVGVGSGVNRFLMEEMAHQGRGFARYLDPTRKLEPQVDRLVERLQTPVLTDIRVDWGELEPHRLSPERLPDLFAASSVSLSGIYTEPGHYEVTVSGRSGDGRVEIPLEVSLPGANTEDRAWSESGEAVRLLWARSRVADLMHLLQTPRDLRPTGANRPVKDQEIEAAIIELGLAHNLSTQWTSFVAVADEPAQPEKADQAKERNVATRPPSSHHSSDGSSGGSTGHSPGSTPEPLTLGGLLVMAGAAAAARRRR